MATVSRVGRSTRLDSYEAGQEAARAAITGLPDPGAHFCIVFATSGYDQARLLKGIRDVTRGAPLSGCSGEGIITTGDSSECDHACAVMAIHSTSLQFDRFLLSSYSDDPAARGRELAARIGEMAVDDAIGLVVMPDGLRGNCTDFLHALTERLPVPLLVAGGAAADAMTFESTWQYLDDRAANDSIAAVLIRGKGSMEVAVSHGCSPIGLERSLTRADGGWIYEIDGQPAWTVFKEYLDGDPEDLNAEGIVHLCVGQPLDVPETIEYAPYIIRTPLSLDKERGALFFPGGGLSTGDRIRLTRRDPRRIQESARACASRILGNRPDDKPALVLQFDCAGRGRVLFGARAAEEIVNPLQETLGAETPWIGFHTYGEIAPIGASAYYHNYTVVLCAVYEKDHVT